jgi:hypothetical protein
LDDIRHYLGNETMREYDGTFFHYIYSFNTGIQIGTNERNNALDIFVDFGQEITIINFQINGIGRSSTYNDVAESFGNQPHDIRTGAGEEIIGAVKSYGFWLTEHEFVRFFFDERGVVVAIHLFLAEA